jgi:Viral BACON domain
MRLAAVSLATSLLYAANIPLTVGPISSTRAVVTYTPTGGSCTYTATASILGSTYTLNTSSPASIVNQDASVSVEFGSGSAAATLPASRSITVGVACNAGADSGTATFITPDIPVGNTFIQPPPFNPAKFGNYDWPAINFADQSSIVVDPMRGTAIKRAMSPGWYGRQQPKANFDRWSGGAGWTGPDSVLKGATCDGTTANCAQTANTNKLFLPFPMVSDASDGYMHSAGFLSDQTLDDVILIVRGRGSDAASESRRLNVCLSYFDSTTCDSPVHTIDLGTSNGDAGFPAATLSAWSSTAAWGFAEWGGAPPARGDFGASEGTVTVAGGTNVTLTNASLSYQFFNVKWKPGALIYIAGSGCTDGGTPDVCKIASVTDTQHLVLQSAAANVTNAAYRSMAAGYIVWKANSTGTVTFGAQYSYAHSYIFSLIGAGNQQICNPNTLSVNYAADGVTPITPVSGNLCMIGDVLQQKGILFLLIPSTGETRLLSPLFTAAYTPVNPGDPAQDGNVSSLLCQQSSWDATVATDFYCTASTSAGLSIFRGRYNTSSHFKAYSHPLYPCGDCYLGGPTNAGQDPSVPYPGARWSDDPVAYTNITPASRGMDVLSQIRSLNPLHDSTVFAAPQLDRIVAGYAVFSESGGMQDSIAVYTTFDLSTGFLVGYGDSFSTWPIRWGGEHSSLASSSAGYFGVVVNAPGGSDAWRPNINTTVSSGISPGSQTVTPASMSSISAGRLLWIDTGASREQVAVTAVTGSSFTAAFANSHNSPVTVTGQAVIANGGHQLTPYSMWKSGAFTTDTSMSASAPFDACSLYAIPQWIIDLGGVTGNHCVKFRAQDVCNRYPSSVAEKTKWPCPSNPNYSQLQGLAAGDEIGIRDGATTEEFLLVASVAPVTDSGCGTNCKEIVAVRNWRGGTGLTWASGWPGGAFAITPFTSGSMNAGCCQSLGTWLLPSTPGNFNASRVLDSPVFQAHTDLGAAPTPGNTTTVQASIFGMPYKTRYDQPFAQQAGSFNGANQISSDGPFHGVAPSSIYQSYPSNQQIKGVGDVLKTFLDFHHQNPALGINEGFEQKSALDPVTYNLVAGTTSVFRFTVPVGNIASTLTNYKLRPPVVYAGRWILQDISSPTTGNVITDSTAWKYCFAALANECRTGSQPGEIYASIPNVPAVMPNCYSNWFTENLPCAAFPATSASQLVQMDASRSYSNFEHGRLMTMGLSGYGKQYSGSAFTAEPTGNWGFFRCDWCNGERSEILMTSLAPWRDDNLIARNDFQNVPVVITGGHAYAEVQFGYSKYGAPNQYRCSWRQEACNTSGNPYAFESEARTLTACSSGCTINIPSLPDHIVYYRRRTSDDGVTWTDGPIAVAMAASVAGPDCSDLSFSLTSHTSPADGDTGALAVSVTDQACAWTASSTASWLTIASGGSGTGNGTLNWSTSSNGSTQRNASITAGSASFLVTQTGCTLSISPGSTNYTEAGGATNISITASTQSCAWTATSPAGWVTVGPASGAGSGSVTVTAGVNSGSARNANVTIAGQTLVVTQDAASPCTFSLNPTSSNYTQAGGALNVSITASSQSCAWTASSPAEWVTVSPANGTGNGSITVTAAVNNGSARNANLTIGGQTFTATQDVLIVAPAIPTTALGSGTVLQEATIR